MAVIIKRSNNYKRNLKAFFNEVFMPLFLIIAGVVLSFTVGRPLAPSII